MKSNLAVLLSSVLLLTPVIALANPPDSWVVADNAAAEQFGAERYSAFDGPSPGPAFDAASARKFPAEIYDQIAGKIALATTFVLVGSDGTVRWAPRSLQLIAFIKTRSHSATDDYLYVLRYAVTVSNDVETEAVYDTSCQVAIASHNGVWDRPSVGCEPLQRGRPKHMS